ncbi:MAG: heavy metal translocating P-type ATPase, partial [Flavobacterium sp.]
MEHIHKEEKITKKKINQAGCCSTHEDHGHSDEDDHDHDHSHNAEGGILKMFLPAIISFILLLIGIGFDHYFPQNWFTGYVRIGWYIVAYLPVGLPVLKEAYESIMKGDVFSEFFLMCIATIGAFAIGEYPEGVAVMLFYTIGENFQGLAVSRA